MNSSLEKQKTLGTEYMKVWMTCEVLIEGCAPNVTVLEIRNTLKRLNHEVTLFCPSTERKHAPGDERADMRFVPTVYVRWLGNVLYQLNLGFTMLISSLGNRPDWVYTRHAIYMISPALVAKLIRVPHIVHLSGDTVDQLRGTHYHPLLVFIYALVEGLNCWLSDRVVVTTQNNKITLQRRYHLAPDRVVFIANGANTELFRPIDRSVARDQIGLEKHCVYVGFTGNLWAYEGVSHLVEAAPLVLKDVPEARFLIVGDGPTKNSLVELAKKLDVSDKFVFTGRVPYERVPMHIAALDVCVVPLNTAMCGKTGISSLKLREYLSCGRPVVGSDVIGVSDILTEAKAGTVVVPENTPQFAGAITRLLQDKALREEMGSNGRQYALEHLSWKATTESLLELYEGLRGKKTK